MSRSVPYLYGLKMNTFPGKFQRFTRGQKAKLVVVVEFLHALCKLRFDFVSPVWVATNFKIHVCIPLYVVLWYIIYNL